jgi:beta-lactamase regulating signal transducer with metallopeptidase domain
LTSGGPQLDYGSEPAAQPPRTAVTWVKLTVVWIVGVIMWLIYIAAALYLIFRVLG